MLQWVARAAEARVANGGSGMSKTYRPWNPDQDWLLPPLPREWLPEGDLVYFMLDVVKTLDLSEITRRYAQEGRGGRRSSSAHQPSLPVPLVVTMTLFHVEQGLSPLGAEPARP